MKYVAKSLAKIATVLFRFLVAFESNRMEKYRVFDWTLFGDTALICIKFNET